MSLDYLIPFLVAFVLGLFFTYLIKNLAYKYNIVDQPEIGGRKIHLKPVAQLGGLAIFLSFSLVILYYAFFSEKILAGYLLPKHIWGLIIGGFLLMIGGYLDDKYNLNPFHQIIWPVFSALAIIAAGIGLVYITNPFGGTWYLDTIKLELFKLGNLPYYITLWADLLVFFWILGMVYTTKFLDGLDGLVSGVGAIGSFIIFALSLSKTVGQPETALLSLIFGGALLGFLVFNFHPAKIFLGEGGSTFVGFMLAVLAIISGAKIATALLIMGIPILDVIWVIVRRWLFEKKSPFWADKKHLHFRLLDIGLSHRQAVLLLYLVTAVFGLTSLFLKSREKFLVLGILVVFMIVLAALLVIFYKLKKKKKGDLELGE